jgi:hypothetical protein
VATGPPTSVEIKIYTCNDSVAPQYKTGCRFTLHEEKGVISDNNIAVTELVKLRADLSAIPKESVQIEKGYSNAESFYIIQYGLDTTIQSNTLIFSITYNGNILAVVQVECAFQVEYD